MKTKAKDRIIKILSKGECGVSDLAKKMNLSNQMVHRHLKKLLEEKRVSKKGKMPKVFYFVLSDESRVAESMEIFNGVFLDEFMKQDFSFWNIKKKKEMTLDFLTQSSALFSSKIEGNTLDLNSFIDKNVLPKNKQKDFDEISDLVEAYKIAQKYVLDEYNFLKLHKISTRNILQKSRQGVYRKEKVGVFSSGGLEYLAIESEKVPNEMSVFFAEIAKLLERSMNKKEAVFWSLWIHLMFVLIHPFSDGNGRMARVLEKWFLAEKLGGEYWNIENEKFYWDNLEKYYQFLKLGVNYWEVDFKKAKKFLWMRF